MGLQENGIVLQYSGLEGCLVDEVVSQYTWCIVTGAGAWLGLYCNIEVCRKKKIVLQEKA